MNVKKANQFIKQNGILLIGILLFLLPAIFNYFPLVTSDTASYIKNAYHLYLPSDRPITYSYFILIGSAFLTLWLPIGIQSLLLTFLVISFAQNICRNQLNQKYLFFILIFVTVFTSSSWYSSQLMPDIFTPIIFLASINFMFSRTKWMSLFYASVIFVSILMHNSNLIISLLFFTLLLILSASHSNLKQFRKKALTLFAISILSWLSICTLHLISGNGFKPSKSSHVFLIAKLCENGILEKYLNKHCEQNTYKLCDYKNKLPEHAWDFIWTNNPAFVNTGSWDSSSLEYSKIIKGTLTEPQFLWINIRESLKATCIQFIKTDIGDGLTPQIDGSNPYWRVQAHYGNELQYYLNSRQNQGKIDFNIFNLLYRIIFLCSLLILLLLLIRRKVRTEFIFLLALCFLFCLINAFTTATFANILARLNSRCIWLIPFFVSLIIFHKKDSGISAESLPKD